MQKSTPKFISFLKCQIKKCISIVFPTNFHIAVGTFKTFLGKIEKEIFFVRKSAEISPKMNNFTMKKYLTNTVKYWGRIQIAVECIQFWNVGFEYLQKSQIFVEYPVFGYSVTPLCFSHDIDFFSGFYLNIFVSFIISDISTLQ